VETIVAGTLDDAGGDAGERELGDAGMSDLGCRSNEDCRGQYCDKLACGDALGTCKDLPREDCDDMPSPVCGCDHVTYFNECLRRRNGTALAHEGPCQEDAWRCGDQRGACPFAAVCSYVPFQNFMPMFMFGQCPSAEQTEGTCWVAPEQCSGSMPMRQFTPCGEADGECLDLCAAIRSEKPFTFGGRCGDGSGGPENRPGP
jgi:hypothetical protein